MAESAQSQSSDRRGIRSFGPAIIIAAVVLGPGSILANSKVGWQFGYELVWVVVGAGVLLMAMTALSARLGVFLDGTLCEELARRGGRPLAAVIGISLFLVTACFQFSNNLGVLLGIEPFLDGTTLSDSSWFTATVLVLLNALVIAALFGFRRLYMPIERLMKILVGCMLLGFAANLIFAKPSLFQAARGLVPRVPEGAGSSATTIVALVATTFSVGGAFYQSYLVRQKGWGSDDLRRGLLDSVVGIGTLGCMSIVIMLTAAAALHGDKNITELKSAADVARQLRPLFGDVSIVLFCLGIFAGALSSFLINAMIGGTAIADGLGFGGNVDDRWPKIFTAIALTGGMLIAIGVKAVGFNTANLIIFAQAITVLGNPLLAGSMLWLATRPDLVERKAIPRWMLALSVVGFLVVLALSARTAYTIAVSF